MKCLKKWLNLTTISGVLVESLIPVVIFKTIFASYALSWEKRLKSCCFRDKKHLKSFRLKRLKSSSNVTMFLRCFNLQCSNLFHNLYVIGRISNSMFINDGETFGVYLTEFIKFSQLDEDLMLLHGFCKINKLPVKLFSSKRL